MIYKNKLHQSIRYWNKQTERLLSEEYIPKTPLHILLTAIDVQQRYITHQLRTIKNSF
jgi:precorrin-4 methylase